MKPGSRRWLFWPIALLYWPTLVICTFLAILFLFINQKVFERAGITVKSSMITAKINRFWGIAVFWASGSKMTVIGEIPNQEGPFVVVSNHSSTLDIAALMKLLKGIDFRFASRPEWFTVPVLGLAMRSGDHLPLDPKDRVGSIRTLYSPEVGNRFGRGQSLMIFPEGTRTETGKIGDFLGGAAAAAIRHNVPILPIRFWGLYEALPNGHHQPRPSRIIACIGNPISTENMDRRDVKWLTEKIRHWMMLSTTPVDTGSSI